MAQQPRNSKIKMDFRGSEDFQKKVKGSNFYARVGVLNGKNTRVGGDPYGNAEIGLTQEFGSISHNIPPRSWLRMPLEMKRGMFIAYINSKSAGDLIKKVDFHTLFARIGVLAENIIQDAFASRGFGMWAPNSPVTIDRKGSSAPLIDTAQLRRSVTSEVVSKK